MSWHDIWKNHNKAPVQPIKLSGYTALMWLLIDLGRISTEQQHLKLPAAATFGVWTNCESFLETALSSEIVLSWCK